MPVCVYGAYVYVCVFSFQPHSHSHHQAALYLSPCLLAIWPQRPVCCNLFSFSPTNLRVRPKISLMLFFLFLYFFKIKHRRYKRDLFILFCPEGEECEAMLPCLTLSHTFFHEPLFSSRSMRLHPALMQWEGT